MVVYDRYHVPTHLNIIQRALIYRCTSTLGNYILRFIYFFQLFVDCVKIEKKC